MENALLKIIKHSDTGAYGMYIRIEDQYRLILPNPFFKKLWKHDSCMYEEVGPGMLMYKVCFHRVLTLVFFDKDLGRKEVNIELEAFRKNFREVYEEFNYLQKNGADFVCGDLFYGYEDSSNYIGSIDTLFDSLRDEDSWDNIQIVPFSFEFTGPYETNYIGYRICIGNNEYFSSLVKQFVNFDLLRSDIELAVLIDNPCRMEHSIHLESSGTTTKLNLTTQNTHFKRAGFCNVMKVTLESDDTVALMVGWCDGQQVIRSLYLGLLRLCTFKSEKYLPCLNECLSWDEFRLDTYNRLQSCVLEQYIIGGLDEVKKSYPRQRWMNTVEEMENDYAELCERLKN